MSVDIIPTHTHLAWQATQGVSQEEELLAVREMMDLTAHDLLESQLLDEATVPSCSPLTTHPPRLFACCIIT